MVKSMLTELKNKYPNESVGAIFGGATFTAEELQNNKLSFHDFVLRVIRVGENAYFWNWCNGTANAMRTFCHLCFVDPALVEAYLGTRFDELAPHVEQNAEAHIIRA